MTLDKISQKLLHNSVNIPGDKKNQRFFATTNMDENHTSLEVTSGTLKRPLDSEQLQDVNSTQPILPEDSAVTKIEKIQQSAGVEVGNHLEAADIPAAKRIKTAESSRDTLPTRTRGEVSIKPE